MTGMENIEERWHITHYRTNRKTKWAYAMYAGRWESKERAIAEVAERLKGEHGEYLIDINGSFITGFIN